MAASWGQSVDRTFETVERMLFPAHDYIEGLVVIVATRLTARHFTPHGGTRSPRRIRRAVFSSRTLDCRVPIGEEAGLVLFPCPHMQVPERQLLAALERLAEDTWRLLLLPFGERNDVLYADQLLLAVAGGCVDEDLGSFHIELIVQNPAVHVVLTHTALGRIVEAGRGIGGKA